MLSYVGALLSLQRLSSSFLLSRRGRKHTQFDAKEKRRGEEKRREETRAEELFLSHQGRNAPSRIPNKSGERGEEKRTQVNPKQKKREERRNAPNWTPNGGEERRSKMMSIQEQATLRSGVKQEDAFAIDEVNMYQRLGQDAFVQLSTNFYNRVYDDENDWFKSIFANSAKEEAIQNQYEFFIQRMGGPPLYSRRKGHPALIGRHAPYAVTERAAERWLQHMRDALDSTESIDADSKTRMWNFFRHTAFFLVTGKEMMSRQNRRTSGR